MATCINHPLRPSLTECRKCGQPICDQCSQTMGRFCSQECAATFKDMQSRIADTPISRRRRFSLLGCSRTLIIAVVLCVVIWFSLVALLGTSEPASMLIEFKRMWRIAF